RDGKADRLRRVEGHSPTLAQAILPSRGYRLSTVDDWTISHFSQSNPTGEGQGDVPALLRRVADSIEALGDVQIEDITFSTALTAGEDDLTITVYYHREPRRH